MASGLAEESEPSPGESELAVNPFDGLPFSSCYYELLEQRRALPIWAARFLFLEHLESSPTGVVLVSGEPGSGKSTQIPQWCAEFALARGFQTGQVTVTQPYPLAAMSLASRVADEMDLTLGHEIGYSIPQEDCTGPNTMLRFCWDRLFLQEVASTRGPGAWSVLVLDEAQERSVASDLLQGLLRDTRLRNLPGDPRVVIVTDSALEPKFQAFWGNSPTVHVPREPGENPTLTYKDTVPADLVEAACQAVLELCQREEAPGDVLVYLPSEEVYNPRIRAESQVLRRISKCQAEARLLRARGFPPGTCLRLYSKSTLDLEAPPLPHPKVCEENLSSLVLLLKRKQIAEPGECHFLDRPAPEALMQALEDLDYLAALDDDGDLSDLGIILSEFPLPPELAKALLASCEFNCVDEMLTLAAMLTAAPGFTRPPLCAGEAALRRGLEHADGDHSSLIQVYEAFVQSGADETWCQARGLSWEALCQARKLRAELLELMQRIELPLSLPAFGSEQNRRDLQKALLSGYFLKAMMRRGLMSKLPSDSLSTSGWPQTAPLAPYSATQAGITATPALAFFIFCASLLSPPMYLCFNEVARDTDGTGNYLLLTHKHVAQLSPYCVYRNRRTPAQPPTWVLYHRFSISKDNCLCTVSEIQPEMLVELAPPYFLSNLPPSESRDLLNQLREGTEPSAAVTETASPQEYGDGCVLQ